MSSGQSKKITVSGVDLSQFTMSSSGSSYRPMDNYVRTTQRHEQIAVGQKSYSYGSTPASSSNPRKK